MEVFDVKEVAKYLNCSISAIRKLVTNNSIPYYRVGTRIFFRKLSIDTWIEQQELKHNCVDLVGE